MKTRHFFGAMTLALASLTLASCSGGGSSDSGLFGALPGEMTQYESEMKALEEKAKDIKTEADKKKLIAESQEIQEKYTAKIEETAKALDGTTLKITDGEFAVAQPVTLTFDGFANKKTLSPRFKLGGELTVPADFSPAAPLFGASYDVYLVGYDAEETALFASRVGFVGAENVDGKGVVKAGTPVTLETLTYNDKYNEVYPKVKSLKFVVDKPKSL